jgi:uncharacterized protein
MARSSWHRRLVTAMLVLQLPFAVLLWDLLRRATGPWLAIPLAAVLTGVANIPLARPPWSVRKTWPRVWLADVPYHAHTIACLFAMPVGLVAALVGGVGMLLPVYAAGLALGLYATLIRRFWTVVRRIPIRVAGLPPELDGYRIAQISDVHCGPFLPRWFVRRLARRTTRTGADAIVVTGDLIDRGDTHLDDVAELFRGLAAADGVYAALGNHDHYGTHGVPSAISAGGGIPLENRGITVGPGLHIAAVDDDWSGREDVHAALSRTGGRPTVVLAHHPESFPTVARRAEVVLVLSGHTHGGQLAVPFLRRLNLYRLRGPYSAGLYTQDGKHLYVHSGNGTSGITARLGAAPEIAIFELKSA